MNFPFRGKREAPFDAHIAAAALEAQRVLEAEQLARLLASEEAIRQHTYVLLGKKSTGFVVQAGSELTVYRTPVLGGVLKYAENGELLRTLFDVTSDNSLEVVVHASKKRDRYRFAPGHEGIIFDSNGTLLPLQSVQAQEGLRAAEMVCERLVDFCNTSAV